jgi:hypothetical protein
MFIPMNLSLNRHPKLLESSLLRPEHFGSSCVAGSSCLNLLTRQGQWSSGRRPKLRKRLRRQDAILGKLTPHGRYRGVVRRYDLVDRDKNFPVEERPAVLYRESPAHATMKDGNDMQESKEEKDTHGLASDPVVAVSDGNNTSNAIADSPPSTKAIEAQLIEGFDVR